MTVTQWLGITNEIGINIWEKKYQFENEFFDDWLDRVSGGDSEVRQLIVDKKFLFGGRILANRGLQDKGIKTTYSNCYVLPSPEDNIESIFDTARDMARTFSYGGGVGIDLGKLSPAGAKLNNAAKSTTGAVSFMDLYSLVSSTISQQGRRGALMLSLPSNHPDLEAFIESKTDLSKVTGANISVRIDDKFMEAVEQNLPYELYFKREETGEEIRKTVQAVALFRKLCEANWNYAEPGILYWDNITRDNLMSHINDFYSSVNPCAEEPLGEWGACLLGSLNLSMFVDENKVAVNMSELERAVRISVRALNQILEEGIDLHPLQQQKDFARKWQSIGLGFMGLADMLIKLRLTYGARESINLCNTLSNYIFNWALHESALLAKEKGAYPAYTKEVLNSIFLRRNANKEVISLIEKYGLRNNQILTCAPTGTISTMIGVSGGIEPIFANYYTRTTKSLHGEDVAYRVYTPIVNQFMEENFITEEADLPEWFITSSQIDPINRIKMQAAWQKSIDASISSTINLPNEATVEDVEEIYMEAWRHGLKGITIYRVGCAREGILVQEPKKETKKEKSEGAQVNETFSVEDKKEIWANFNGSQPALNHERFFDYLSPVCKDELGETYGINVKRKTACGKLYLNICRDEEGNLAEIFINIGKGGICQSNINAISRLVSLSLRAGVRVDEIVHQLKGIVCPACTAAKAKGEILSGTSCPDVVGRVLQEIYQRKETRETKEEIKPLGSFNEMINTVSIAKCPECGESLRFEGGCVVCGNCGYSKCG